MRTFLVDKFILKGWEYTSFTIITNTIILCIPGLVLALFNVGYLYSFDLLFLSPGINPYHFPICYRAVNLSMSAKQGEPWMLSYSRMECLSSPPFLKTRLCPVNPEASHVLTLCPFFLCSLRIGSCPWPGGAELKHRDGLRPCSRCGVRGKGQTPRPGPGLGCGRWGELCETSSNVVNKLLLRFLTQNF